MVLAEVIDLIFEGGVEDEGRLVDLLVVVVGQRVEHGVELRFVEILDLDEPTAAKLLPLVNRFLDVAAVVVKDSGGARRELKDLLDAGKPDDAKVNKLVDRLLANRARQIALQDGLIKDARKLLTPTQTAKLVVALPQIRERIGKRIRKAMKARAHDDDDGGGDDGF